MPNANQINVFFLHRCTLDFELLMRHLGQVCPIPLNESGKDVAGRTNSRASRPPLLRCALLPLFEPPRPDPPVVFPGFGFDRFTYTNQQLNRLGATFKLAICCFSKSLKSNTKGNHFSQKISIGQASTCTYHELDWKEISNVQVSFSFFDIPIIG